MLSSSDQYMKGLMYRSDNDNRVYCLVFNTFLYDFDVLSELFIK